MTDFKSKVEELVGETWGRLGKATLLNYLGSRLSKEFDLPTELQGAKLLPYLRFHMSDELDVINNPDSELIWGAIPKGEANGLSNDALAKLFIREEVPNDQSLPAQEINFHRTVWAAFSKPLARGHLRALKTSDPKQFGDYAKASDIPEGYRSISDFCGYLHEAEDSISDASLVRKSILGWSKSEGVDWSELSFDRNNHSRRSLLSSLMNVLSEEELRSVSLPLSVIRKLM